MANRWLLAPIVAIALVTVSCAAGDGDGDTGSDETTSTAASTTPTTASDGQGGSAVTSTIEGTGPAVSTLPTGPSALDDPFHDAFPDPLVDPSEIISGGPPPDGIPPIDDPAFLSVADNLQLLPPTEPVVALTINGDARAYPVRAMVWHEIVNDTVGGVPVSVTYCPLCNSAATYERTIDGSETTFGTSGRLWSSALVMYDRATESLWTHYDGTAVVGVLTGTELVEHPSPLLSWDAFRQAYPTGQVLDWTETGFSRRYGTNPYTAYDDPDNTPFLFRGALDDRAAAMERIVGIELNGEALAVTLDVVNGGRAEPTATPVEVDGQGLVIFWEPGQSSALDTTEMAAGYDVGSVGVFIAAVDGEPATFTATPDGWIDDVTGTTWSITGESAGDALEQVPHLDSFWFAWAAYQPGTRLIER